MEEKINLEIRSDLPKNEIDYLLADSHLILNKWKNSFFQLLNVHNISDVSKIEVQTAEPLVPGPSRLEVEIAIATSKKCKSPGSDQIPAELIQPGRETLLPAIHEVINYIWNKEELPNEWKESVVLLFHKKRGKTDCSNYHGITLM
jgi:hypothetical protein